MCRAVHLRFIHFDTCKLCFNFWRNSDVKKKRKKEKPANTASYQEVQRMSRFSKPEEWENPALAWDNFDQGLPAHLPATCPHRRWKLADHKYQRTPGQPTPENMALTPALPPKQLAMVVALTSPNPEKLSFSVKWYRALIQEIQGSLTAMPAAGHLTPTRAGSSWAVPSGLSTLPPVHPRLPDSGIPYILSLKDSPHKTWIQNKKTKPSLPLWA